MVVVIEEFCMKMKRVNRIKFSDIDEIDPYTLTYFYRNLAPHVFKANCIDRVNLIPTVKIGIKSIHDHHKFAGWCATFFGVNNKCTIQTFMHMALQWK